MTQKTHAAGEPATTRPMTGDEYLESLKDGREVYIFGERVKDVTSHPAFRNSARMTARLYDAMQNPARNSPVGCADRYGQWRHHAPLFQGAEKCRRSAQIARCDCCLAAHRLRLARPRAGLQSQFHCRHGRHAGIFWRI